MSELHQSSEQSPKTWKTTSIILGSLLAVALVFGIIFFSKYRSSANQAVDLSTLLDNTRTQLEGELADLNTAYTDQITINDTLSSELQTKIAEVNDLQVKIEKARKELRSSQANSKEIKDRLAKMEELKVELENDIVVLKKENENLAMTNEVLSTTIAEAKDEINTLNSQVYSLTASNDKLTKRLHTLAPAGFRADNFTVMAADRRDKVTTKGKKIDEISVSFDLNNVPEEFHGPREIYLVMTEFNGNPVAVVPAKDVKLTVGNDVVNVKAADQEKVNIRNRQSITMSFEPTDDLEPGTYNVMVYADNGYLGSSGFLVSK